MEQLKNIDSFNPRSLDISFRENEYVLYNENNPMTTPSGNEISHTNLRLLQYILFELSLSKKIDTQSVNGYTIYSSMKDCVEKDNDYVLTSFDDLLNNDYIFNLKIKYQNSAAPDNTNMLEYLDFDNYMLNLIFGGVSSIRNKLNRFLNDNGFEDTSDTNLQIERFTGFIKNTYTSLPPSGKAAVNILNKYHDSGIILPLLFVLSKISPSEYAVLLFTILLSTTKAGAIETNGTGNYKERILCFLKQPEVFFNTVHSEALKINEFLSYFGIHEDSSSSLLELIKAGESFNLEFKSTLRWNIKAEKKDPAIEHASLKTINGFLNSGGGNLLIGVRDDGSIEGIETDQFLNDDKFLLHFWNLVKESFGNDITPFIKCSLEKIDNRTVCNVQCLKSHVPVFLAQKGFDEEFYIRVGPSSVKLGVSETYKYISEHFRK